MLCLNLFSSKYGIRLQSKINRTDVNYIFYVHTNLKFNDYLLKNYIFSELPQQRMALRRLALQICPWYKNMTVLYGQSCYTKPARPINVSVLWV